MAGTQTSLACLHTQPGTDAMCDEIDGDRLAVTEVFLRGPALWFAITPDDWSILCHLARQYGWSPPQSMSHPTTNGGWMFKVEDKSAMELAAALANVRRDHTDRQLGQSYFGRRGWKDRLWGLISFFQSGGVAVFVSSQEFGAHDR